jgi:hypothetical protein
MKKVQKCILKCLIAFAILIGLIPLSCLQPYISFGESQDVEVTEFTVCNKAALASSDKNFHCGNLFPADTQNLYACGYIDSNSFVVLSIMLYKDPLERPIYSNPVNDRFENGQFCREIFIPSDDRRGSYRVIVYHFRQIVAFSAFEIR